jgi:hypothetical protein
MLASEAGGSKSAATRFGEIRSSEGLIQGVCPKCGAICPPVIAHPGSRHRGRCQIGPTAPSCFVKSRRGEGALGRKPRGARLKPQYNLLLVLKVLEVALIARPGLVLLTTTQLELGTSREPETFTGSQLLPAVVSIPGNANAL